MTDLDLRERDGEYREAIFDALSAREVGDRLMVVADRDIDPHLARYQIERSEALDWTYAEPDAEPRRLQIRTCGERDGLGAVDVRDLRPHRRHEVLLETFDELDAGEGFVLVNDHDPKPLYHELRSMHGDAIDWTYRSKGEDGWRVEIRKTADSNADTDDVVTRYDVGEIPESERVSTVHHRYGMLPDGGTLELILPADAADLETALRQRYADAVWEVINTGPDQTVVHATKRDDRPEIEVTDELDVRSRPPAQRHELIFDAYADLDDGEGFVLVNDHDPKPLYHQFDAEEGPEFTWRYRQKSPGEFRALVGKAQ